MSGRIRRSKIVGRFDQPASHHGLPQSIHDRFGEKEIPLEQLVELFGAHSNVRLREGFSARGKPLLLDGLQGDAPKPRVVLENPRRNPITGNIETSVAVKIYKAD